MTGSRFPGFYKLSTEERQRRICEACDLSNEEWETLISEGALTHDTADKMIENVIGQYALPFGVGLNFQINGKDYLVPMAVEEPSIIASASHIAKMVRQAGGFTAKTTERMMIGQIQVLSCPDLSAARRALFQNEQQLLDEANATHPKMVERGGGAKRIEVRTLEDAEDMLVVHLLVNTCDAMGANTINTMVETIAPQVERLTGGKVHLRILSNFTDECLASARCVIPQELLASDGYSGERVRDGIVEAFQFADRDIYRAVTHNKGVMNGIDPVVIATGNDWRAIEAAAHAYASRFGRYRSMTEWFVDEKGSLVGTLELPMPVGIVGASIGIHPTVKLSHKLLQVENARELAEVIISVGLAQNLGALKALATEGIQKGHMALQARSVAMTAGARGELVNLVAEQL
ncbi:MAG TPA: hydroxymethylglutaryl-CoA reductase, degradative, partial [Bacillales bacterium]|nr:hydroxymethylglutaryl-CoA reductase, degradative [Bacillales bacterium]